MKTFHIAASCNERYVPGALEALAGVAVYARPETPLKFHVFTEGVKDESVAFMRATLKRLHPNSEFQQHVCDEELLKGLPYWAGSRMAAVRCYYATLMPDVDWCLYLDCDVLYLANVEEHFSYRDDGVYACVVLEEHEPTRVAECKWIREKVKEEAKAKDKAKAKGGSEQRKALAVRKVEEWLTGVTRESFDAALLRLVNEKISLHEYRFKRVEDQELALAGARNFFDEFSRKIVQLSDGRCVYFAPDARSKERNANDLSRCWAEYAFHAVSSGGRRIEGKDYNERWYNSHKAVNLNQIVETLQREQCFVRLKKDARADSILFAGQLLSGMVFDVITRIDEFGNVEANLTEVTFEATTRSEKKLPRLVPLVEAVQTVVHHQTTAGSYPSNANNISNFGSVDNPKGITPDIYFNSGVVLFNFKKMREDGIPEKLVQFFRDYPDVPSPDQDALNATFAGNIKMLPPKFDRLQIFLTDEKMAEHPVIHYVNGNPWLPKYGVVMNNRFRLWHRFADTYIWQKRGESYRRLFTRKMVIAKWISWALLKLPVLGRVYAWVMFKLGFTINAKVWYDTQVGFDISRVEV